MKKYLLLISVFIIAGVVRFYNYPNRVTFWSEQARSLMVSAAYLKKPSLLGQEYFRQDSYAHVIYSGAFFNYSLVPLLLITKYDPIFITVYFTLLNLFTGWVLFYVAEKIFSKTVALISTILFLFNSFMIYHSMFIWNYNYLPLVGLLSVLFLIKRKSFLTGLISGFGFGLQILFAPFALLNFLVLLRFSKSKLKSLIFFIAGFVIANLPMVLFDLRHGFYESQTILRYLVDSLRGRSDASFAYYYLLPLWPIAAIILGFIISRMNRLLTLTIIATYILINLNSGLVNFNAPTGIPNGLNVKNIENASQVISNDTKGEFNVSEVLDFDKRAYMLRYYLQYKFGKTPLPETDYQNLKVLYVLSEKGYNFDESGVWEIKAGGPFKISMLSNIGKGYGVYKLEK